MNWIELRIRYSRPANSDFNDAHVDVGVLVSLYVWLCVRMRIQVNRIIWAMHTQCSLNAWNYLQHEQTEWLSVVMHVVCVCVCKIPFAFKCLFVKRMYSIVKFCIQNPSVVFASTSMHIELYSAWENKMRIAFWRSAQPGLFMSLVCLWMV